MTTRIKLVVAGAALGLAATLLAVAGARDGWVYYLSVDEYLAADASQADRRVRLHGVVGTAGFSCRPADLAAEFELLGEQGVVRVVYTGVVPDMFQTGSEVVVEGRRDEQGIFRADTLLTKCASKYESAAGEAPHADPRTDGGEGA
jgi:cytochrome c-type biogenesis protein CcmE